ncbi:MAG: ankyrin repeat protein, partial [Dokdonia sp.]
PLLLCLKEIGNEESEIIRFLIEKGADVNITNGYGETATHLSARRGAGFMEITKLLLANNADLTIKTLKGKTPLDYASDKEVKSFIKKALKK